MKKILRLQSALLKEIDKYEKLIPERDHLYRLGESSYNKLRQNRIYNGRKRGVDPILAAAACA